MSTPISSSYIHEVKLPVGSVHVYANPELFAGLDYKVFNMANNNLQIPGIQYMGYLLMFCISFFTLYAAEAIFT